MTFLNKSFSKLLLVFLFLILFTRLPFFWETYLHSDEALFSLSGQIWNLGGLPYRDFFETKPLGIYIFYRFASWLMGSHPKIDIQKIHFFSIFWTLATAGTLYWIGKRLYSEKTGYWSGILFILFSSFWGPDIVAMHIEVVLILPLCLAYAFLAQYPQKNSLLLSFCAGLFASAAFLCKYQAGIFLPQAFCYLLFTQNSENSLKLSRKLLHCLSLFLGFIPLIGLHLLYLSHRGVLQDFLFWNLGGNFSYIEAGQEAVLWQDILFQLGRHFISSFALWFFALFYICSFFTQKPSSLEKKNSFLFLILWLLFMWIPVSTGRRFEDHYFLLLLPPLCLMAAQELVQGNWLKKKSLQALTLFFFLTPTIGFTLSRYLMHDAYRIWGGEDMSLYQAHADFIRNKTSPNDRIFVWGCVPSIYLLADRLPASRFLRTDNLAGRIAGLGSGQDDQQLQKFITPGSWEMFFEDVRKNPPLYILDTATAGLHDFQNYPLTRYPEMQELLEKHYEQEPSFEKVSIYRRRNSL